MLSSCAQVVAPTGGEKDVLPPTMLLATPPHESIGFNAEEIIIQFDEYIQFRNLNEQLLISPPMEKEPNIEIRGKNLLIELRDSLEPNTTYLLNFGNAIVDLNEGNPYGNFTYVFSTGKQVDSLELKGQVLDAYSLKADKNVLLMLYRDFYDSIPMKELPDYVSRTDEEGRFLFTNLAEGSYHILALDDKNKNFKYNPVAERIAFIDKSIPLDGKFKDSLQLFLFAEKNPITYVLESKTENASLKLVFNNPVDSLHLSPLPNEKIPAHFIESYEKKDTFAVWFPKIGEGLNFRTILKDRGAVIDTISVKLPPLKNDSSLTLAAKPTSSQNYFKPYRLVFNSPVRKVIKEKMELYKNDSIAVDFKPKHSKTSKEVFFVANWEEGKSYRLVLLPGACIDVYGRENDSIVAEFTTNKAGQFGSLKVQVETQNKSPMIMQLMNEQGKILRESKLKQKAASFEHLSPGNYLLKLVFDQNKSGKWETGNYFTKQFPERAVLFDGKINIRPKWEQELVWKIK